MLAEPFPIQWDAFFPDVVPSLKLPDVVGTAAPDGQAVAAPVLNTRHSEKDMNEKKIARKQSPTPKARKARPSLMFCLSLSVTAALAAGCASTSPLTRAFYEEYVKNPNTPDPDPRLAECPPESVESMTNNGVAIGSFQTSATFGSGYGQKEDHVPLSQIADTMSVPLDGTGVEVRRTWGNLTFEGVMRGAAIIQGDRLYVRFVNFSTRNELNIQIPVCMEVWHGGKPGVPHFGLDPEKPGFVKVLTHIQVKAVSHFD